ncbi:MAG: hypothetical protein DELT_03183 [Desulfovibrio sp.]
MFWLGGSSSSKSWSSSRCRASNPAVRSETGSPASMAGTSGLTSSSASSPFWLNLFSPSHVSASGMATTILMAASPSWKVHTAAHTTICPSRAPSLSATRNGWPDACMVSISTGTAIRSSAPYNSSDFVMLFAFPTILANCMPVPPHSLDAFVFHINIWKTQCQPHGENPLRKKAAAAYLRRSFRLGICRSK